MIGCKIFVKAKAFTEKVFAFFFLRDAVDEILLNRAGGAFMYVPNIF